MQKIFDEYYKMVLDYERDHNEMPDVIVVNREEYHRILREVDPISIFRPFEDGGLKFIGIDLLVVDEQIDRKIVIHSSVLKRFFNCEFYCDFVDIEILKDRGFWIGNMTEMEFSKPIEIKRIRIHKNVIYKYQKGL